MEGSTLPQTKREWPSRPSSETQNQTATASARCVDDAAHPPRARCRRCGAARSHRHLSRAGDTGLLGPHLCLESRGTMDHPAPTLPHHVWNPLSLDGRHATRLHTRRLHTRDFTRDDSPSLCPRPQRSCPDMLIPLSLTDGSLDEQLDERLDERLDAPLDARRDARRDGRHGTPTTPHPQQPSASNSHSEPAVHHAHPSLPRRRLSR